MKSNLFVSGNDFLEKLKQAIPNLQVAVPIHCSEWDTKNYIPLVAFLPFDYNEENTESVIAYDAQGNTHILDVNIEPDVPVIVVGRSERVDENGNLIALIENNNYLYVYPLMYQIL